MNNDQFSMINVQSILDEWFNPKSEI